MDFADGIGGDRAPIKAAAIDPLLDLDVGFRFDLKLSLFGVLAVVTFQGALNIDRVHIVPFDEIAGVAIHRAHEVGQRAEQASG